MNGSQTGDAQGHKAGRNKDKPIAHKMPWRDVPQTYRQITVQVSIKKRCFPSHECYIKNRFKGGGEGGQGTV